MLQFLQVNSSTINCGGYLRWMDLSHIAAVRGACCGGGLVDRREGL